MKHVCVAARIGDGKAHGAGNSHSIAKTSNAASADSGCNPLGLARVLAWSPRLSAKGLCCWGGDGGQVAHLNFACYVAVPANWPAANESRRHIVASHLLRMTKPRAVLRVLSQNRDSASRVSFCNGLLGCAGMVDDIHGCQRRFAFNVLARRIASAAARRQTRKASCIRQTRA